MNLEENNDINQVNIDENQNTEQPLNIENDSLAEKIAPEIGNQGEPAFYDQQNFLAETKEDEITQLIEQTISNENGVKEVQQDTAIPEKSQTAMNAPLIEEATTFNENIIEPKELENVEVENSIEPEAAYEESPLEISVQPEEPIYEEDSDVEYIEQPISDEYEIVPIEEVEYVEIPTEDSYEEENNEIQDITPGEAFIPEEIVQSQNDDVKVESEENTVTETQNEEPIFTLADDQAASEINVITPTMIEGISEEQPYQQTTSENPNETQTEEYYTDSSKSEEPYNNMEEISVTTDEIVEEEDEPVIDLTPYLQPIGEYTDFNFDSDNEENSSSETPEKEEIVIEEQPENQEEDNIVPESPENQEENNEGNNNQEPTEGDSKETEVPKELNLFEAPIEEKIRPFIEEETPLNISNEENSPSETTEKEKIVIEEQPENQEEDNIVPESPENQEENNEENNNQEPTEGNLEETEVPKELNLFESPIEEKIRPFIEEEEIPLNISNEETETTEEQKETEVVEEQSSEESDFSGFTPFINEDNGELNFENIYKFNQFDEEESSHIEEEPVDIKSNNEENDISYELSINSFDDNKKDIKEEVSNDNDKGEKEELPKVNIDTLPQPILNPESKIIKGQNQEKVTIISEPTKAKFCNNCGTMVTDNTNICPSCGSSLN